MKEVLINSEDMKNILAKAFTDRLKNEYSNPAKDVVDRVFAEFTPEFESILRETLRATVLDPEFKKVIRLEFKHKVAKTLVADLAGSVERATNTLKQDPRIRSEMILAIEKIAEVAEVSHE